MYKLKSLFIILFLFTLKVEATPRGCIAIYKDNIPISVEVDLPNFSEGIFQTQQFSFSNLPSNMIPNQKGSYCYELDDDRFAFVHSYFYAVNMILDYNQISKKLNLSLPKKLVWTLVNDSSSATSGYTDINTGKISYPKPTVDQSTLCHEIGHWVHYGAAGRDHFGNSPPMSLERALMSGVEEGSANLLASLHLGITKIGVYDGFEVYTDIDSFVRFPDVVPSTLDFMNQILSAAKFNAAYPSYVDGIKSILSQAQNDAPLLTYLKLPNPYTASNVINQPVWRAAVRYGFENIKLIYIQALSNLNQDHSYSYTDLAKELIKVSSKYNFNIANDLSNAFKSSGLDIEK